MTPSEFAAALVNHQIIDIEAWNDPEGFDHGATKARVERLHEKLFPPLGDQPAPDNRAALFSELCLHDIRRALFSQPAPAKIKQNSALPIHRDLFPYTISVVWSPPNGAYIASVPKLRYCIAHGDTPAQATQRLEAVTRDVLAAMREDKKPIPPPDFDTTPPGPGYKPRSILTPP